MAYTPTPGRGNGPKTGAGLPTSLNSGSTNSTNPFPVPSTFNTANLANPFPAPSAFTKDSDGMTFEEKRNNRTMYNPKSDKFIKEPFGMVTYDQEKGEYAPKPVTSKFSKFETNRGISTGDAQMYVNNNLVGKVPKNIGEDKEAYRAFVSDSLDTSGQRRINAAEYNQKLKNLPKPNKEFYDAATKHNADVKAKTLTKKENQGTVSSNPTGFMGSAIGQAIRRIIRQNVR